MAYDYGFSSVYDRFCEAAEPERRAEFALALLRRAGVTGGILLDLCCGTGKMTEAYVRAGFDVIGADLSEEMLDIARARFAETGSNVLLLCQDMRELDLFGTINACVCTLDSVNHLTDEMDVLRAFERVSLFTEPGGAFVFDVNTPYKHAEVLGNNAFVFEDETAFLVWQNFYEPENCTVVEALDLFVENSDGTYTREQDEIIERAYEPALLERLLYEAGFSSVETFGDLELSPPKETDERLWFVAKK
ncbi:MAG: class I SAM-dependent methyltransferase [Clostridia bacterium]|nr:class I SAM-dependent methyltransferase [Clostridia bacterium]